ncbi:silver efflux pump [Legionella maceachernii]|uniref:Silver efflux pump n=2 Tax=Legionellaceae TaxID=444 RepID=A0A0W0W096_9GAMM|nr:silver efflux pump [Legionella maceachernii]SJZ47042.1 hypothetical protein SAMN02745128_00131 [Legionella maceachernii]SUP03944.1 Uncharacterised protein [Legionella maceachernii]
MDKMKLTGAALAIGAAALFSAVPTVASAHCGMVKCLTVNGCRGFSSCKTANNSCKGMNACKGQGFVYLTRTQCQQILGPSAVSYK